MVSLRKHRQVSREVPLEFEEDLGSEAVFWLGVAHAHVSTSCRAGETKQDLVMCILLQYVVSTLFFLLSGSPSMWSSPRVLSCATSLLWMSRLTTQPA